MQEVVNVEGVLADFTAALREALGDGLRSIVLFGSAAEGRLRPTSDVNVVVVVRALDAAGAGRIADAVRLAHVAVRLQPMFLLEAELPEAVQAFAVKFADVRRRRRILFGADPFAALEIPRDAEIWRLRQVLLNLTLRLRGRAIVAPDALLAAELADAAGPLRAAAAAYLELQGEPAPTPREALARLAPTLDPGAAGALEQLTAAREGRPVAPAAARAALWTLIDVAMALRARVALLRGQAP